MSKRSSRSRPSRATRWLTFFGLALATYRADGAAPTEWPVKKDADYGHVSVKNFDDSTSAGHLKINTGAGTTIKAAAASTGGDIFANGYTITADGISARLKTVEDRLAQLRDDFDDTSVAELTDLHDKCTSVYDTLNQKIDALETDINSTAFTPPECSNDTTMRGIVRIDGEWVCMCKGNYTTSTDQSDYGTCDVSPCDLSSTGGMSNENVTNVNCGSSLAANDECEYKCDDSEPTDPNPDATTGNGHIVCSASGTTASLEAGCTACTGGYSGENCKISPCDLSSLSNQNVINVNCGSFLAANDECEYKCDADSEPTDPNPDATTGNGHIVCPASGTTASLNAGCTACTGGYSARTAKQRLHQAKPLEMLASTLLERSVNILTLSRRG